ncbi:sensor histidine kinase [Salinibacter grassmerensis]|uniref:sensor histidine kinase n=1 Tax=Salinibacter grassmerensis TaxID=3040353 RepID=UPI0021E96C5F|nr:ATP-binding protein [Salinibacter grassmerensis]
MSILLALAIPYVGWRLFQDSPGSFYLPEAIKYALAGGIGLALLAGLVVGMQVLQEEIDPRAIVLQLAAIGAFVGLYVGYSVAQLKRAKEEVQGDRRRLENLLDGLPVPVVHGRLEGEEVSVLTANAAFEEVFGHAAEESEGKNLQGLIRPVDNSKEYVQESPAAVERRAIEEGVAETRVRCVTPDGQREFKLRVAQALDPGAPETYSVYTDITERKRQEEKLRALNTRLQLALDASNTGTFDWKIQAGEVIWDETSERLFGYEPGGFPGTLEAWARRVHPDDLSSAQKAVEQAIENREKYEAEFRVCIPDGQQRWVEACGTVEYDGGGEPIRMLGIHTDITEQKKREEKLREAKDEAEEASRLKSAMLANVTHEIRTPLTSITGFSEILEQSLSGRDEDFAARIRKNSRRLQRTLESVLHLSKLEAGVQKLGRERFSLGAVIEDVATVLRDSISEKSLILTTEIPDPPVIVSLNEDGFYRICRNLLENAIKFTPEGGHVEVRVWGEGLDESLNEGRSAVLEVEDTGIGMDPERVPDLFQAFKQESQGLAREYEGSGLGLSIVQQLTEELGGTIDVETEKGVGTCFTVEVPLTDDA